jgi:hypothetical protein
MIDDVAARNEELIRAYRLCFGSAPGQIVMADLMKLCCFRRDAADQIEEGMRRAFLRIVNMSNLTDEQLYALYSGRNLTGELNE